MKKTLTILAAVTILFAACSKEETDQQKPEINHSSQDAYPQNCDTLWLGETFTFKSVFTDNQELGTFSIEIRENFDHHAHSTETEECEHGPEKEPVNPFEYLEDFQIPGGSTQYEASVEITIPESDVNGPVDEGDYHLFISLTDREGWSEQKGLSIKIMSRQ
ncbi:MAG: DUF4625 domain-containing protein [Mariniphaga sp.]